MLYLILIILGISASIFGVHAWNKISKIEDENEKNKAIKKYQYIGGSIGVIAIVIAGIIIFTMF